jgi:hypothetical protein
MNDTHPLVEAEARHQIAERVARAASPRIPSVTSRHRIAQRLRRFAERIDN